jgi:hypothetical protein
MLVEDISRNKCFFQVQLSHVLYAFLPYILTPSYLRVGYLFSIMTRLRAVNEREIGVRFLGGGRDFSLHSDDTGSATCQLASYNVPGYQ